MMPVRRFSASNEYRLVPSLMMLPLRLYKSDAPVAPLMVTGYVLVAAVPPPLTAVTDAVLAVLLAPPARVGLAVNALDGVMVAIRPTLPPRAIVSVAPLLKESEYVVALTEEDEMVTT